MCRRFNTTMVNLTKTLGVLQNVDDCFRGDKISILYDPGKFPAILQNSSSGEYFHRNGGVPQLGNLPEHLVTFEQHVNELMPDPSFDGLAVIDFESWRPTYRQNFGTLKPYKDLSEKLERQHRPLWPEKVIQREAERRFEFYGRRYMQDTLYLGQKLRPNATWGYYGMPYCFNGRANHAESCPVHVKKENNNYACSYSLRLPLFWLIHSLRWLFDTVDAVYPSVYMSEHIFPQNRIPMVKGRVEEAMRLIKQLPLFIRPYVFVYHRFLYTDSLKYITEDDTYGMFNTIKDVGADGIILWGSSSDLNTREKCTNFHSYLSNVLAPAIKSILQVYSVRPIQ